MFYKWRSVWKKFFGKWKRRSQTGIMLNSAQMQAFIELQSCILVRGEELARHYPEISFLLKRLAEDGQEWEWFPNSRGFQNDDLASLHSIINQDLKIYPYNYQIISFDEDVDLDTAQIQLISPGLRHKSSRDAIVKAKVSIYNIKTTAEKLELMSDLNEL